MRTYARITGTGSYLPPRRLTNADLVAELATQGVASSDEWIVERTGIRARHFADAGMFSSDLALEASKQALTAAKIAPQDLDLIIVATSTPDMVFPSTACILQNKLGANGCAAFDVQAVCSGFVYALSVADAMIQSGAVRKALVVGAEVFSRIIDFKDRTTCVLFGDGAGAVVLEASTTPGILACDLHADGKHVDILCTPGHVSGGEVLGSPLLRMDGQAVFKMAVGGWKKRPARCWPRPAKPRLTLIGLSHTKPTSASCKAQRKSSSWAWTRWWSRWISTATPQRLPSHWRWMRRCVAVRSSRVNSSCSKVWGAVSLGVPCS